MKANCHIHMILDGENWKQAIHRHSEKPDEVFIRGVLARYQQLGYTYLRDGGDRWGVGKAARAMAPVFGITYRTPYAPLCKQGHYGGFIGICWNTLREYASLVRKFREEGADFIKVMISGLMDFDRAGVLTEEGLTSDEIHQLVHIAHEEGMSVMAHANGAEVVLAAAEAGVDSVEHGAYIGNDSLHAMLEAGTVWVPTLSTIGNLRGRGRFDDSAVCRILDSAGENVEKFAAMGGLIAPGDDAGAWAVPHGCETEVPLLREVLGSSTDDILQKGIAAIKNKF